MKGFCERSKESVSLFQIFNQKNQYGNLGYGQVPLSLFPQLAARAFNVCLKGHIKELLKLSSDTFNSHLNVFYSLSHILCFISDQILLNTYIYLYVFTSSFYLIVNSP